MLFLSRSIDALKLKKEVVKKENILAELETAYDKIKESFYDKWLSLGWNGGSVIYKYTSGEDDVMELPTKPELRWLMEHKALGWIVVNDRYWVPVEQALNDGYWVPIV